MLLLIFIIAHASRVPDTTLPFLLTTLYSPKMNFMPSIMFSLAAKLHAFYLPRGCFGRVIADELRALHRHVGFALMTLRL